MYFYIVVMKISEIIYYCLDAIKAFSDDSTVNEDHILFLLGKYRGVLLQQYHNIKKPIPESNYQIVCLNLEPSNHLPCVGGKRLVSIETLPHLIPVGKPSVLMINGLENEVIEFVSYSRLKSVGWNKFKRNFIYASIGPDNHLYLSFTNPQAKYLECIKFKGIFEDFEKALELECKNETCELLDKDFPLEVALIPDLIAKVVKEVLGVAWRPADQSNNANDDLADIATFVRRNMKSNYAKQLDIEE